MDTSQNGKIERTTNKLFSERFDASLAQKWRKTAVARIFGDFSVISGNFNRENSGFSINQWHVHQFNCAAGQNLLETKFVDECCNICIPAGIKWEQRPKSKIHFRGRLSEIYMEHIQKEFLENIKKPRRSITFPMAGFPNFPFWAIATNARELGPLKINSRFILRDIKLKFWLPACFLPRNTMVKSENCYLIYFSRYKICPNMVTVCRAHTENGKFSQNGLKMVLGYQGLRPWP